MENENIFGKANISKNKKGEYWVNFEEPLYNDERKVCCVINQQIIDNTLSKNASKKLLEGFYIRKIYIVLLSENLRKRKTEFI